MVKYFHHLLKRRSELAVFSIFCRMFVSVCCYACVKMCFLCLNMFFFIVPKLEKSYGANLLNHIG